MALTEKNKKIEQQIGKCIQQKGYGGKLEFDPIPNTFKRRNPYTTKADGVHVFTGYMWQLNKLDDAELQNEIDRRIDAAARHFGI